MFAFHTTRGLKRNRDQWVFEQVEFKMNSSEPLGRNEYMMKNIEEREISSSGSKQRPNTSYASHWVLSSTSTSSSTTTNSTKSSRKETDAKAKKKIAGQPRPATLVDHSSLYREMYNTLVGQEEATRVDKLWKKRPTKRQRISVQELCHSTDKCDS